MRSPNACGTWPGSIPPRVSSSTTLRSPPPTARRSTRIRYAPTRGGTARRSATKRMPAGIDLTRRQWLAAMAIAPVVSAWLPPLRVGDTKRIVIDGDLDQETRDGVAMGLTEARRTATLLGEALESGTP